MQTEEWIGKVTHYYPKAHAAAIHLERGDLHLGDVIHIKGRGGELEERVTSLEIDREPTEEAHAGDDVGVWVERPVEEKADVFLVHDPYDEDQAELLDAALEA